MRHWVLLLFLGSVSGEVLQNGGFESGPDHWNCWDQHCATVDDKVSGLHGLKVTDRKNTWNGPMQFIQVSGGKLYRVSGHVKLLNDHAGHLEGERVQLEIAFKFRDSSDVVYVAAAERYFLTAADGWVQVRQFTRRTTSIDQAYASNNTGPDPSVDFVCDDASITELTVTYSGGGHWRDHTDNVLQTKRKSDIHLQQHFNWAGAENALKWNHVEPQENQGSRSQPGVGRFKSHVQGWVRALSGDRLRDAVKHHINDIHACDTRPRYLEQTRRFKSANVGLYGIGVQCHFPDELEPNPDIIK
ncbi:hypothetical protein BaRGS_00038081, partial [Batillaria attramentaria]